MGNSENFSLQDFFPASGASLEERVRPFNEAYGALSAEGFLLYSRELLSPPDRRVELMDPLTRLTKTMIMLGSNNYLGLANDPLVKEAVKEAVDRYGIGMGGPPLLNGMSRIHRELEKKLARLKGAEDALLFPSGYQANLGWVNGLLRDGDTLLFDELSHASLFDAIKQLKCTTKVRSFRFAHNDCRDLKRLLKTARGGQVFVTVEGVYSMDGDLAPLPEIASVCREHGAVLVLDDAHGTGVMGKSGAGTAEHFGMEGQIDLSMGTFSKAFGTTGGFIAGKREVVHYLRYFARAYMFSAHLPPPIVAAVLAGLEIIEREPGRVERLHENARYLERGLKALGYRFHREAAIIPIVIPEEVEIRTLSRRFHEEGIFLNTVEYPAVSRSAQRLRVSLMATHTREDLDEAIRVFGTVGEEFALI